MAGADPFPIEREREKEREIGGKFENDNLESKHNNSFIQFNRECIFFFFY